MAPAEERPLQILLVEDNPADVRMAREALAVTRISHELHVVRDGEEAMRFLRREQRHAQAPVPDLMLLDLSLPRTDGHAVLAELRGTRSFRRFPIVVLTGSRLQDDLRRSIELEADQHVIKPASLLQWASELMFAAGLARPQRAA